MREQLSQYKFKKIATESFKNGLRLYFDSILLYQNNSFPSSFQLSVLSLEEFSKSNWVEHYYYNSITNENFPERKIEQKWLNLLYFHPKKQKAFFGWGVSRDYSTKFIRMVENGELEIKKQKATYVGLNKRKNIVDVNARISLPTQIKELDARQLISLLTDYLKEIFEMKKFHEYYFDIEEKDALLTEELVKKLKRWPYKCGLKTIPSFKINLKKYNKNV